MSRLLAVATIALLFAQGSSAVPTKNVKIVPAKGHSLSFERTYSEETLRNNLQFVTKTKLTLTNSSGMLTAKWKADIRDNATDKISPSEASGICRALKTRVECVFNETGLMEILPRKKTAILNIPVGQGVQFYKDAEPEVSEEGASAVASTAPGSITTSASSAVKPAAPKKVAGEMLLGAEEENAVYELAPAKR